MVVMLVDGYGPPEGVLEARVSVIEVVGVRCSDGPRCLLVGLRLLIVVVEAEDRTEEISECP